MTSARSLRLTYGGISVFLSIFLSIVAVWLLTIALNDEQCKHFDREKVYKVGGVWFSEERDRFYDNRLQITDYIGGKRTDEDYCLNIVDNWTIASGVALGAGIFQLLISIGYFHTVDSETMGPRAWTVLWALCHLIFTGCCIAAFFVALSADVHRYHFNTRRAGPTFLAATAINATLSLTLSILAFVFIMKRLNQEEEMYYEEAKQDENERQRRTPTPTTPMRPPSRQKFITDV